jgi:hypothetical protein
MTVTAPYNPSASAAAKMENSKRLMAEFIEYQLQWLQHAEQAFLQRYFLEVLSVCLPQIHSLLRRGLWLQSQNQSLRENPTMGNDTKLFELLLLPLHDGMENVPDEELYNAAKRFDVIHETIADDLQILYRESSRMMRRLFSAQNNDSALDAVKKLAREALDLDRQCLEELRQKFTLFERNISQLQSHIERN